MCNNDFASTDDENFKFEISRLAQGCSGVKTSSHIGKSLLLNVSYPCGHATQPWSLVKDENNTTNTCSWCQSSGLGSPCINLVSRSRYYHQFDHWPHTKQRQYDVVPQTYILIDQLLVIRLIQLSTSQVSLTLLLHDYE